MKRILWILAAVASSLGAISFYDAHSASAQAATGVFLAPQVVSTVSQCAWPTGAAVSNGVAFCFVNTGVPSTSGMFFALNGSGVWTPLVPAAQIAGVTSVNGKTGVVTLAIQ